MPRVPTYDSFQATPTTAPQTYFRTPDVHPELVGRDAKEMGASMMHAGESMARIAIDMADQANQLRVDDATNQLREAALKLKFGATPGQAPQPGQTAGYTQLKGADALYRPDGTSLSDEYGNKLQDHINNIAETLGNDAQKTKFAAFANGYLTGFRTDVSAHEIGEYKDYSLSVAEGIQKTAMNDIALNYNNPAAVQDAVGRIQAETYRQAQIQGKSAEWQEATARSMTSSAHKLAISTALENNNPMFAEDYLKRFSTQMNADDILAVKGQITKDVDNRVGMGVASDVLQKMQPRIQIGDGERAFNVLIGAESGDRQFAGKFYGLRPDGTPKGTGYFGELKRPDGGVMTEYSVGVNINGKNMDIPTLVPTLSAKEKDTLLNIKEGEAIPESIIQKAVDHAKSRLGQGKSVWANTPEPLTSSKGAVGAAQVLPSTGPEAAKLAGLPWDEQRFKYDANYNKALGLAYFQKQIQDNGGDLAKAYAAYNAGPGALKDAVKKADKEGGQWLAYLPQETQNYVTNNLKAYGAGQGKPTRPTFAEIDEQLRSDPRLANNPQRYKIARENAKVQFDEQTKAIEQRDQEATANAIQGLIKNGGRFSDLPSEVRAAIPAKEYDNVMGIGKKIAMGDDVTNLSLYNKLSIDPTKDPVTGQPMSDAKFMSYRPELSQADFKHFSEQRAKIIGGQPGSPSDPAEINMEAINSSLNYTLPMLKLDPTPKDGSADAMRVGAIRKTVVQTLIAQQSAAGKKFTQAEVTEHVNALFAKNQTIRGLISGYSGSMLGMKASDLPSDTVKEIKASLKAQGNESPTDGQILQHYWLTQIAKR